MHLHIETPVLQLEPLQRKTGKEIYAKMECLQPSGSFKIRGIGLMCLEAAQAGSTHFVSSSGGNAGYSAAYAGRKLGIKTTVIVPETTNPSVRKRIEDEGAAVVVHGKVWDEAHACALKMAAQPGAVYIPPFDHPTLWRGHASMIDEMVRQCPKPDAVILSVGGGGLLCGVLEGLHNNHWEDVPVVAVETTGAASFHSAVAAGRLVTLEKIDSIATSLGAKTVAAKTLEWIKLHEIRPVVVSDASAVHACLQFADDYRILVEPACAVSLSVLYESHEVLMDAKTVAVIVCGGIGIDTAKISQWVAGAAR